MNNLTDIMQVKSKWSTVLPMKNLTVQEIMYHLYCHYISNFIVRVFKCLVCVTSQCYFLVLDLFQVLQCLKFTVLGMVPRSKHDAL